MRPPPAVACMHNRDRSQFSTTGYHGGLPTLTSVQEILLPVFGGVFCKFLYFLCDGPSIALRGHSSRWNFLGLSSSFNPSPQGLQLRIFGTTWPFITFCMPPTSPHVPNPKVPMMNSRCHHPALYRYVRYRLVCCHRT